MLLLSFSLNKLCAEKVHLLELWNNDLINERSNQWKTQVRDVGSFRAKEKIVST